MILKSNRELSFGALIDKGTPKEEIMKRFSLTEEEYERKLASLEKIRERAAEKAEGNKV